MLTSYEELEKQREARAKGLTDAHTLFSIARDGHRWMIIFNNEMFMAEELTLFVVSSERCRRFSNMIVALDSHLLCPSGS